MTVEARSPFTCRLLLLLVFRLSIETSLPVKSKQWKKKCWITRTIIHKYLHNFHLFCRLGIEIIPFNQSPGEIKTMEEEVVDHKDTVVHEVEVPTTEQVDAPTEQQEQPDIVQGVPTHSIAEHIPLTPTVEDTSPNAPNVKYLFCKVSEQEFNLSVWLVILLYSCTVSASCSSSNVCLRFKMNSVYCVGNNIHCNVKLKLMYIFVRFRIWGLISPVSRQYNYDIWSPFSRGV